MVLGPIKKLIGKGKEKLRGTLVRSPEELSQRIIGKLEDYEEKEGENKELAKIYASTIPTLHRLYGTDTSIENQVKQVVNKVKDDDIKKDINNLYKRYKKTRKVKLDEVA